MTSKEENMQNCNEVKGIEEALVAKVSEGIRSPTSKPGEGLVYSFTNDENYLEGKDAQENDLEKNKLESYSFLGEDHSSYNEERIKLMIRSSCKEESHQPVHELERSQGLNTPVKVKEENPESEESVCASQFNDSILSSSQASTSQNSTKSIIDEEFKSNGEEVQLASIKKDDCTSPQAPSKKKHRNTKRRAGSLYKQISSTKLCKVTSKYFSQAHNVNKKRWIPPRSPYALVQEDLFDNPWQLLVATIFLTKTTAKKALPQLHKFLAQYPKPDDVLEANYEDIDEYFKPLGLTTTRSHIIKRFTVEFLEKDWTYPRELYGIGKYGDDSYRMFCINEWRQVSPDDIPLTMYRNWLLENEKRLGVE